MNPAPPITSTLMSIPSLGRRRPEPPRRVSSAPSATAPWAPTIPFDTVAFEPTTPITSDDSTSEPRRRAHRAGSPSRRPSRLGSIRAPAPTMLLRTVADGSTTAPGVDRPRTGRAPRTSVSRSRFAAQVQLRATGVDPVVVGRHAVEAAASDDDREHVTLDRRPHAGPHQFEHRRFEHVRAGADEVARLGSGRRLLDERSTRPAPSVISPMSTTPKLDGSSTAIRWIVASAPSRRCAATRRRHVEVGEHVAVGHDERVVDAGGVGGEANRPAGVERLGLDGVRERDVATRPSGNASTNGSGLNPSANTTSVTPPRASRSMSRAIIGRWPIGNIGFGVV